MILGKYIDFRIFLVSLSLGILLVYINQPPPTIIYVYPTPENIDRIQYKDHIGNCYNFTASEVECPTNKADIHVIPIQTGEIN
jgi:hypothetical protein